MAKERDLLKDTTSRAVWYYDFEPPTAQQEAEAGAKANYKIFRLLHRQFEEIMRVRSDIVRAHSLTTATDTSLELWARYYRYVRLAGWNDNQLRDWIRFEILKRRCQGTGDQVKLLVALYLTLVDHYFRGGRSDSPPLPWGVLAHLFDMDTLTEEDITAIEEALPLLGSLSLELGEVAHHVDMAVPSYYHIEIPAYLLEGQFPDAFSFAPDIEGAPDEAAYWFGEDGDGGWEAGVWDGHDIVTDLLEILWEVSPVTVMADIVVDGFHFAPDDEGVTSLDPTVAAYWFVDDAVNGWEAGRLPGALIASEFGGAGALYDAAVLKVYQRSRFVPFFGERHFLVKPEVDAI